MRDLLLKYPNVIAYVAGHTHANRVDLFRKGRGGFWQINTASHIDWPQQSRLIEVMDNRDGTLSLFATILDHGRADRHPGAGHAGGRVQPRRADEHRARAGLERPAAPGRPERPRPPRPDARPQHGVVLNDPRGGQA